MPDIPVAECAPDFGVSIPWVDVLTSVWTPLQRIAESDASEASILHEMSAIIDRCEYSNAPARLAILACGSLWTNMVDALAMRYCISGASIREDLYYRGVAPEKRPVGHWMNDLSAHVKDRRQPCLASPIQRTSSS